MKRLILLLIKSLLVLGAYGQSIVYVTPDGAGDQSGRSWSNSLPGTLLPGRVSASLPGTQFWVAAGTYKPTTTTDRAASFSIATGVSVYGGFTGNESELQQRNYRINKTIFSGDIGIPDDLADHASLPASAADNVYHVVTFRDVDASTLIDGVTIRGGVANLDNGTSSYLLGEGVKNNDLGKVGGGIINRSITKCSTPTISNCVIERNRGSFGSGLYSRGNGCGSASLAIVRNCLFTANETFGLGSGGAVYIDNLSNALLEKCTFIDNKAFWGGGVFVFNCNPQLVNCIFTGNQAGFNSGGSGGGVFIDAFNQQSNPVFYNCLFTKNQATSGGAVFTGSFFNGTSTPEFINCTLTQNRAASHLGGAIAIQDSTYRDGYNQSNSLHSPHPVFRNCIIWNNVSYNKESISFGYNSFPAIRNSIVGGNFLAQDYATVPVEYSGGNNLPVDPLFVNPATGSFGLRATSPAINAGETIVGNFPATDLAGEPRIQGGRIDLGAYEATGCPPSLCIPFSVRRR